jgi:hypothetical protein
MYRLALALPLVVLLAGPATSQSASGSAPKTRPAAASAQAAPERTAKSKECSIQADQKGLHGKARKRFRSSCKKG